MGSSVGDALVRDDRELRPSEAFVLVIYNELPPEAYPELTIEEMHRRYRRVYGEGKVGWRRLNLFGHRRRFIATAARLLTEVVFFVGVPPTRTHIDVEPSKSVSFVRALAAATTVG